MKVLITSGSTMTPIDQVRGIDNIFKGKTGLQIASYFHVHGADVTLLSSGLCPTDKVLPFNHVPFKTFDDLAAAMEKEITNNKYRIIIHSAAVSDFKVSRVLRSQGDRLIPVDSSTKVSSSHQRLYLELEQTTKLVDQIRNPWGFSGKLVKFKLQVGISDTELIKIAKKSMADSGADFIVANCLEWYKERAYIIGKNGLCVNVSRQKLSEELFRRVV